MSKIDNSRNELSGSAPAGEETWPAGLIDITQNLVIREFLADEAELCRRVYIDCGCMADKDPAQMSPEEFRDFHLAYIKYQYGFYGYGNWGIFLKTRDIDDPAEYLSVCGEPVGLVGLVNGSASGIGELSYYIIPGFRRRGYAYEACRAALEYGRECGFTAFEARIRSDNIPSAKLAEKLGVSLSLFC